MRGHRHIADAPDLPVEDDTLGSRQAAARVKLHQIEPPEFQRPDKKMPPEFRKHPPAVIRVVRIGVEGHARRGDGRVPHPHRIDMAGKAVVVADAPPGDIFAAMADRRPAVIRPAITARADDVDLVPAARPVLMRPDIAGARMHRHALRVAVADGEDLRGPSIRPSICQSCGLRVVVRNGSVEIDPDQAAGMGRRVLGVVTRAAVTKAGIDHAAGHLQPASEMMA